LLYQLVKSVNLGPLLGVRVIYANSALRWIEVSLCVVNVNMHGVVCVSRCVGTAVELGVVDCTWGQCLEGWVTPKN